MRLRAPLIIVTTGLLLALALLWAGPAEPPVSGALAVAVMAIAALGAVMAGGRAKAGAAPSHDEHYVRELQEKLQQAIAEKVEPEQREARLRRVMTEAGCLIFESEISTTSDWKASADPQFIWISKQVDDVAARRTIDVEMLSFDASYFDALTRSRNREDETRISSRFYEALQAGEEAYSQEYRATDRHGKEHWLSESVSITPMDANHWRAVGTVIDITSRKRAELEKQAAELRLRQAMRGVRALIFEGNVKALGDWRNSAEPIPYQWHMEELDLPSAQNVLSLDLKPGWSYVAALGGARHPDDSQMALHLFHKAIREGEEYYNQEYRCRNKQGQWVWLSETMVLTPNGESSWHFVGTLTNVTERKNAELARAASEKRLAEAMSKARILVYEGDIRPAPEGRRIPGKADFDWAVEPVNIEAAQDVVPLDVPPGWTYLGRLGWSRFEEDNLRMNQTANEALLAGRSGYGQEFRVRDRYGKVHWLVETISLTAVGDGSFRFVGTTINITELKQAQEAAQATAERLRRILREVRSFIFEGQVEAPEGWEKLSKSQGFQWTHERLDPEAAETVAPFGLLPSGDFTMAGIARLRHPADVERLGRMFLRAVQEGWKSYNQEYRIRNQEGQYQWLAETVHLTRTAERSWRFVGTASDITQAKLMQEDLGSVMRQAGCIIWYGTLQVGAVPEDAEQWQWNMEVADEDAAQRVLSLDTAGKSYLEGWVASRLDPLDATVAQTREAVKRSSYRFNHEYRCRDRHGAIQWISEDAHLTQVAPGRYRAVCVCVNITAQKSVETALREAQLAAEQANAAKSMFLANMSHEIRTPMTAILGYAELLQDQQISEEEQRSCVNTIRRNGEHLLAIINNILDLSKIEAGRLNIELAPCSPRQIASEVVELLRPQAEAKGLSLSLQVRSEVPEVILSDPTRLRQILLNLTNNAVKFTDCGGVSVRVGLAPGSPQPLLKVEVVDTGIGMTPEQMQRIFQPFEQSDASITRRFGGTGLGLTIARRLAQLLGGDVAVLSTAQQGSTFVATVVATPADRPLTPVPALKPKADLTGTRVLLAEDGADNRRLICFHLQRAGCEITTVENGRLACDLVMEAVEAGKGFDIILMDMQMPVMDGYAATEELRRRGYTGAVIALTAHVMEGDRQRCIDAGCNDYAAKPINVSQFLQTVARNRG